MRINENRRRIKFFRLFVCVSILAAFGANCSRNAGRLTPENPITDKIMNDEVHTYTANLEKGQFISLAVEQRDVDVITKVFTPENELIGEFDTPTSGRGTEIIRFGTDAADEYRIEIYTLSERAEPGEYKLSIADFHPLNERDQEILSAVKFHQEADILRSKPETRADSIPLYEKSLAIWRELGEAALTIATIDSSSTSATVRMVRVMASSVWSVSSSSVMVPCGTRPALMSSSGGLRSKTLPRVPSRL